MQALEDQEDPLHILRLKSYSVILYINLKIPVVPSQFQLVCIPCGYRCAMYGYLRRNTGSAELNGIAEHIGEQLLHQRFLRFYYRKRI